MKFKLLNEKQVMEVFGISTNTLRRMRAFNCQDPIPFVKVGGSIRYREDLLIKWIERNTFFSNDEYLEKKTAG